MDRVAGMAEDWWDTRLDVGDEHVVRYSRQFGGLGLKTTKRYKWRILLSLGLKTLWQRFQREPVVACGITAKGATR